MAVGVGKGVSVWDEMAFAVGVGITVDTGDLIVGDGVVSEGVGAAHAASMKAMNMTRLKERLRCVIPTFSYTLMHSHTPSLPHSFPHNRQFKRERAPLPHFAFHFHARAVRFNKPLDERQPQP